MKTEIKYKEIDIEGEDTLNVISAADNFNEWMFKTIRPYCSGKILEVGSGVGNISNYFLNNDYEIFLTDIRDNYCDILTSKFNNKSNLLGVQNIDLVANDFENKYPQHIGQFDTVFALNVVEHIENDQLAIANCKKLLKSGGTLIILVPAYQALYNQFDKELFHYKRYVRKEVIQLFSENKIEVKKSFYFNALGIAGWFVSGKLAKNRTIPSSQMGFYNKIVFIAKMIDFVLFKKIGLSTIVVGKKK
jgi:SAM-dependent methyltransferase